MYVYLKRGGNCLTDVIVFYIQDNSFDLVFTSPPFFDYEMYRYVRLALPIQRCVRVYLFEYLNVLCIYFMLCSPRNPKYSSWIEDFYVPLMQNACRCVMPGRFGE